jgi:hypothetical protein
MKQAVHIIEIGILLVAVAIATGAWMGSRTDTAKLKTTLTAEHSLIEQAANREQDRDKLLASAVDSIKAQMRQVRTASQAAKAIPSLLPELPQPLVIPSTNVPPATPDTDTQPAPLNIPADDVKPLYDHLQNCRICAMERDTAKQDLADQQARNVALAKERDAAVTASKGGTLWNRAKRAAKWFSIGVVVGISGISAYHSKW